MFSVCVLTSTFGIIYSLISMFRINTLTSFVLQLGTFGLNLCALTSTFSNNYAAIMFNINWHVLHYLPFNLFFIFCALISMFRFFLGSLFILFKELVRFHH